MTGHHGRQRPNGREKVDAPERWEHGCAASHQHYAQHAKNKGVLKPPEDQRQLDEERGVDQLLRGAAPGHFDGEEMGEEGLRDVQGDASEEDAEHGDPGEVLEDCEHRAKVSFARFGQRR